MSRVGTGQVLVREREDGRKVYALRFRAGGRRVYETLGDAADGWTERKAEQELEKRRAAILLGQWEPPTSQREPAEPTSEGSFWTFAREWFEARQAEGLSEKTLRDFEWGFRHLEWFGRHRLSEITVQEVDRFKIEKATERRDLDEQLARWEATEPEKRGPRPPRGLSNSSINHVLRHLSAIMETAVEYGLVASNPASGRRRRLKATPPARPWVEPEQLPALLDATSGVGRVLLSLLAGCGVRIGEALALKWADLDLGTGSLFVRQAKTAAGVREVHLPHAVREVLTLWRNDSEHTAATDYVVHTATGGKHNPSNLRRDVLSAAVAAANETLEAEGIAPIGRIGFHSLRRTYASLHAALGDDVRYVASQLGHTDPRFTLRVYAQATGRRERMARPQRAAYDRALEWAPIGHQDDLEVPELRPEATKNPA